MPKIRARRPPMVAYHGGLIAVNHSPSAINPPMAATAPYHLVIFIINLIFGLGQTHSFNDVKMGFSYIKLS